MIHEIYKKLAAHLDNLPGGFPATGSGVEIRILQRLFMPEEAALALHLTLIPESAAVVAGRAKMKPEETALLLEKMATKGLIIRLTEPGCLETYMAAQFVIGIWEYHVKSLDEQLAKDMEEYLPFLSAEAWKSPQMRTIPVNRSISADLEVTTYEMAEKLVENHRNFVVAPCICRERQRLMGNECDKPKETCLIFGKGAEYYLRNGLGRSISRDEVFAILKKADEAGLVLQPGNSKSANFICCCCGCCCDVLKSIKHHPEPGKLVVSAFHAELDAESCIGCEICVDRCQMEALSMNNGKAVLQVEKCIGCGLCVSTCETGSLRLVRKPEELQPKIPKNIVQATIRLGRARGKLSYPGLVKMEIKSKIDRMKAPKMKHKQEQSSQSGN